VRGVSMSLGWWPLLLTSFKEVWVVLRVRRRRAKENGCPFFIIVFKTEKNYETNLSERKLFRK
jgi:hypothetical protein